MARPRTIPDEEIFAAIRRLLTAGGDKAVAFSSVARATGLAAPTLVQRYGSRDNMLRTALLAGWDDLDRRTAEAEAEAGGSEKGAVALLKSLADMADLSILAVDFRDSGLRERATAWRERVETALTSRMGGGAKGREAASLLFAAWQGQALWDAAGGRGFRLKDAVKRLS